MFWPVRVFVSDGPVNISDATLSLNSRPDEVSHTLLPVYDYAGSWNLKGDDARLNVGAVQYVVR